VTIPAGGLFSVNGSIKFNDGDLKRTFAAADLVAIDAILACIGRSGFYRKKKQDRQVEPHNLSHNRHDNSCWILAARYSTHEPGLDK